MDMRDKVLWFSAGWLGAAMIFGDLPNAIRFIASIVLGAMLALCVLSNVEENKED